MAHLIAGCAAAAARTDNSEGCAAGGLGAVVGESTAEIGRIARLRRIGGIAQAGGGNQVQRQWDL
ncbi:hypothetical protein [Variovorax sp.]|uniref:hypothetical protein n=1 Tax=Variovorax sp. TaxID=1871043 RepID=UPI002D6E294A|nr:hypothetical protein [Variovorax sp.]HYP86392.1 hypothetical protein [Variovorax sp.]